MRWVVRRVSRSFLSAGLAVRAFVDSKGRRYLRAFSISFRVRAPGWRRLFVRSSVRRVTFDTEVSIWLIFIVGDGERGGGVGIWFFFPLSLVFFVGRL